MKLQNMKTGEILKTVRSATDSKDRFRIYDELTDKYYTYNSLAELNAEWEDVIEFSNPYYMIDEFGAVHECEDRVDSHLAKEMREILVAFGNYFETKEEAEKTVEKLKAWKILKNNGFRFIEWEFDLKTVADGKIWFDVGMNAQRDAKQLLEQKPEVKEALELLFGGEE